MINDQVVNRSLFELLLILDEYAGPLGPFSDILLVYQTLCAPFLIMEKENFEITLC